MKRRMRRITWRALQVGAIVALAIGTWYVLGNRIDPSRVPQSKWHQIATATRAGTVDPLPAAHKVVIEPLSQSPVEVFVRYLPPPLGRGASAEMQGKYDGETGRILITGDLARLQASLRAGWMQPVFRRTLRHEYGHALLSDWVKSHVRKSRGKAYLPYTDAGAGIDPKNYPPKLQPLVTEFLNQPENLYGQTYLMSTFDEYFAESYQRYVSGESIPPKTRAFLDAARQKR